MNGGRKEGASLEKRGGPDEGERRTRQFYRTIVRTTRERKLPILPVKVVPGSSCVPGVCLDRTVILPPLSSVI